MSAQTETGPASNSAAATAAAGNLGPALLAAAVVAALGLLCFSQSLIALWGLWTGDALRSVGMFVPPVALWLMLRQWTAQDWGRQGSWWGLPLIALAIYLANLHRFHPFYWLPDSPASGLGMVNLLPLGPLLWAYASGVVLLFGGVRTWRKAWFGLALLLLVNPVPVWFTSIVDPRLQYLGAHAARAFAGWIGVPLGGDALKLMFTPDYSVFIAPGCDGLRGAVTMGLLALVIGHLRRLRPAWHALYVASAVALAYVFNLLRLAGVVLYSWGTLRLGPGFEGYGEQADYLMGGLLFVAAALFLMRTPRRA
jgi:exosortase J